MNTLKPPTDNLYKFFAVSGIVLIGFFTWLEHGTWHRLLEHGLEYEQEYDTQLDAFDAMTVEYGLWFTVVEQNMTGDYDKKAIAALSEAFEGPAKRAAKQQGWFDRNDWVQMVKEADALGNYTAAAATSDYLIDVDFFVDNTELVDRLKKMNSMSDEEFTQWMESSEAKESYLEFIKKCVITTGKFRRLSSQGYMMIAYLDDQLDALFWRNVMRWIGGLLAVSGFVLWYFKVQRFQDAIVKRQANQVVDEAAI